MGTTSNDMQDSTPVNQGVETGIDQSEVDELLEENQTNGEDLTLDDVFDILRNGRRRKVLEYLDQVDGRATLGEIAEHVAAEENGIEVNQLSSQQRKRVYIGLYQVHLPKMDELAVIDYDQDRGTVELEDISELRSYLYDNEEQIDLWTPRVIALFVGAVIIVGIVGTGATASTLTAALGLLGGVTLLGVGLYPNVAQALSP